MKLPIRLPLTTIHVLALAGALAPNTQAQGCNTPDGLDGGCWQQVQPTLPAFPAVSLPGAAVCFEACAPTKDCVKMELSAPMLAGCTHYLSRLDVFDCGSGDLLLTGDLRLDYTRTWRERSPGSQQANLQVWRFTAKGDIGAGDTETGTCIVPTSLGTYPTIFYSGYVDMVFDCAEGSWTSAAMLFHGCDAFQHAEGLSSRPGDFDPETSFALVMPDTAANPFLPSLAPAPGGPLSEEALRTVRQGPGPIVCRAEEPLDSGVLVPLASVCLCPLAVGPAQVTVSYFEGRGTCLDPTGQPSSFQSLNAFPQVPWFELVSFRIGEWTTGANYPGPEQLWANEGLIVYRDSCVAASPEGQGQSANFLELHYGATTKRGFPVLPVEGGDPLSDTFVDTASNLSHRLGQGNPVQLPILGDARPTDHLIYVNVD